MPRVRSQCYVALIVLVVGSSIAAAQSNRTEIVGWPTVLAALWSQFNTFDVIALGEAHGRDVDADLRARLIRDADVPRQLRMVVTEFADKRLDLLVATANAKRPLAEQIRVVVGRASSAALISERVRRGEKTLVVYGAGHVWNSGGRLTNELRAAGVTVFVVQTLAPPTPRSTLAQVDALVKTPERPLFLSLKGNAVGLIPAVEVYPSEPIAPGLVLDDLSDAVVMFGAAPNTAAERAESHPGLTPGSTLRLSGRLAGLYPRGRHVYLLILVEKPGGGVERWAVQGGSREELSQLGWSAPEQTMRLGEQLIVEAHAPAANVDTTATDAPPQIRVAAKSGQFVIGLTVTLPSGRMLRLQAAP